MERRYTAGPDLSSPSFYLQQKPAVVDHFRPGRHEWTARHQSELMGIMSGYRKGWNALDKLNTGLGHLTFFPVSVQGE